LLHWYSQQFHYCEFCPFTFFSVTICTMCACEGERDTPGPITNWGSAPTENICPRCGHYLAQTTESTAAIVFQLILSVQTCCIDVPNNSTIVNFVHLRSFLSQRGKCVECELYVEIELSVRIKLIT
jgi:hypothetical protein